MNGPEAQFGGAGGEINQFDVPNNISNAFDVDAYDELVRAHGIQFKHFRCMIDPSGMVDLHESRKPGPDHGGGSNGMIYTEAGVITAAFTGVSKALQASTGGIVDSSTAQITPARFYDHVCNNGEPRVYLAPGDRLYLSEESVLVTRHERVEAHNTGKDRLKFPAVKVLDLIDAAGNRFTDSDFKVCDGQVEWGAKRPQPAQPGGKAIYSVRYLFRPHWYVERLSHDVRMAQFESVEGVRTIIPVNQCAFIQREFVYLNEQKDQNAPDPDSARQVKGPASGQFGPR